MDSLDENLQSFNFKSLIQVIMQGVNVYGACLLHLWGYWVNNILSNNIAL